MGLIARARNGLDQIFRGLPRWLVVHSRLMSRQIDACGLDTLESLKRLFDPADTGSAGHAINLEPGGDHHVRR